MSHALGLAGAGGTCAVTVLSINHDKIITAVAGRRIAGGADL
jgi:hypothetical protein